MHLFNRIPQICILTAALAVAANPAAANDPDSGKLAVGETVPAIEALDQHEKPFTLRDDTAWLLISFEMGTGKAANRYFEEKGASFLDEKKAVFVASIYGMPGIGRVFALPKMRKYPHRIILADADGLLDPFPEEDGRVTVIKLAPGRVIESISFWDAKKEEAPLE